MGIGTRAAVDHQTVETLNRAGPPAAREKSELLDDCTLGARARTFRVHKQPTPACQLPGCPIVSSAKPRHPRSVIGGYTGG
jgi:hypothetical protein